MLFRYHTCHMNSPSRQPGNLAWALTRISSCRCISALSSGVSPEELYSPHLAAVCHFQKEPHGHQYCFANVFTSTWWISMFLLFLTIEHNGKTLLQKKHFCDNSYWCKKCLSWTSNLVTYIPQECLELGICEGYWARAEWRPNVTSASYF